MPVLPPLSDILQSARCCAKILDCDPYRLKERDLLGIAAPLCKAQQHRAQFSCEVGLLNQSRPQRKQQISGLFES